MYYFLCPTHHAVVAESTEWGLKSRCLELSFWSELLHPKPSLARMHSLSESMSTAILRAQTCFERLLTMRPDSIETMQSYAVFLLEVKRESVAADKLFDRADEALRTRGELVSGGTTFRHAGGTQGDANPVDKVLPEAQVTAFDRVYNTDASENPRQAVSHSARARSVQHATHAESHSRAFPPMGAHSVPGVAQGSNAAHPFTPAHDPLMLGAYVRPADDACMIEPSEEQQLEGRQRRRSSLGAIPAVAAHPSIRFTSTLPVGPSRRSSNGSSVGGPPFSASHRVATSDTAPLQHDDRGSIASVADSKLRQAAHPHATDQKSELTSEFLSSKTPSPYAPLAPVPTRPAAVTADSAAGVAGAIHAKKQRAIAAVHTYAAIVGRRRRSSATDAAAISVAAAAAAAIATSQATISAASIVKRPRQVRPAGAPRLNRRGSGSSGNSSSTDEDHALPSERGSRSVGLSLVPPLSRHRLAALERSELGMSSRELTALETEREGRVAAVAHVSRQAGAARRMEFVIEANAQALRDAIKARARLTEPPLVVLQRTMGLLFVLAAVLHIILVALACAAMVRLQSTTVLLQAAAQRQLHLEAMLHFTQQLVLVNGAILQGGDSSAAASVSHLLSEAAGFDKAHRELLQEAGSGIAALREEAAFYAAPTLAVAVLGSAPGATPGVLSPVTTLESFSDFGIAFASAATSLVKGSSTANATASNPHVWYLLTNGPGVARLACSASSALLRKRADAQTETLALVNMAVTATAVLLFAALALAAILPIVIAVTRTAERCFAIFLRLPQSLLHDMQTECAAQVAELRALFEDHESFLALAGPVDAGLLAAASESRRQALDDAPEVTGADVADDKAAPARNTARGAVGRSGQWKRRGASLLTPVLEGDQAAGQGYEDVDDNATGDETPQRPFKLSLPPGGTASPVPRVLKQSSSEAPWAVQVKDENAPAARGSGDHREAMRRTFSRVRRPASSIQLHRELLAQIGEALSPPPLTRQGTFFGAVGSTVFGIIGSTTVGSVVSARDRGSVPVRGSSDARASIADSAAAAPNATGHQRSLLPQRRFQASCGQAARILLRFYWPFVLFAAYFLALYGFTGSTSSALATQLGFVTRLSQLQAALPAPDLLVQATLTEGACLTTTVQFTTDAIAAAVQPGGGSWAGSGCSPAALQSATAEVDGLLAGITSLANSFAYGTPQGGAASSAIQTSAASQAVLLQSACVAEQPGCATFSGGVVASGAIAALVAYTTLLREALQIQVKGVAAAGVAGRACPSPPDFASPSSSSRVLVADALAHVYMPPAFARLQASFLGTLTGDVAYYTIVVAGAAGRGRAVRAHGCHRRQHLPFPRPLQS